MNLPLALTPQAALQSAVDIVNTSTHDTNKIAATIFHERDGWALSRTNYWPAIIEGHFGKEQDIGNSSGTIHAETACIFAAALQEHHPTEGASIAITDPPCPNCVKNMAEAGIDNIYIDHKGFHKDFAKRRIEYFQTLSVRLAEKAGMSIYEVNRKSGSIIPITIADKNYIPFDEEPVNVIRDETDFIQPHTHNWAPENKQAIAFCRDPHGQAVQIISTSHPARGFRTDRDRYEITHPETKYSFIQESCNRLLMQAARLNLKITDHKIYCSEVPTSRELVNMLGAGILEVFIKNSVQARDEAALLAKQQLKAANIIRFTS